MTPGLAPCFGGQGGEAASSGGWPRRTRRALERLFGARRLRRRGGAGVILALSGLILAGGAGAAEPAALIAARAGAHGATTRFVLELSGHVPYTIGRQAGPDRVVIELPGVTWTRGDATVPGAGRILGYRFESVAGGNGRVVLETAGPARVRSSFEIPPSEGHRLRLVLDLEPAPAGDESAASPAPSPPPLAAAPAGPPPASVPTPAPVADTPGAALVATRVAGHADKTRFVLELSEPVAFQIETAAEPYRVTVRLPRLNRLEAARPRRGDGLIRGYRVEPDEGGGARAVLEATGPVRLKSAFLMPPSEGHKARLVVDLVPVDAASFAATATPQPPPEPAPAPAPAAVVAAEPPAPAPEAVPEPLPAAPVPPVAGDEAPASVVATRIGVHPDKTRFVLEVSALVAFRVDAESDPGRVLVHLPRLSGTAEPHAGHGLIRRYRFEPDPGGDGVLAVLEAAGPVQLKTAFLMPATEGHPPRLVIDLVAAAANPVPPPAPAGEVMADLPRVTPLRPGRGVTQLAMLPAAPPPRQPEKPRPDTGSAPALAALPPPGRDKPAAPTVTAPAGSGPLQTLSEVLVNAYEKNPRLNASRQQLKAVDELVPQALSGYRPQVSSTGSVGRNRDILEQKYQGASVPVLGTTGITKSAALEVVQPVLKLSTSAQVRQADNQVLAQRGTLRAVEAQTFLDATNAYLSVWRDREVLRLLRDNEQALRQQVDIVRKRFTFGEVSQTDVLQTESRQSRATGDRIQAEGTLNASNATFVRTVGFAPGNLREPDLPWALPGSREEATALAAKDAGTVIAARYSEAAAKDAIEAIDGQRYPTVQLRGTARRDWDHATDYSASDTSRPNQSRDTNLSVRAELVIPLYTGGTQDSRYRQAYQTAGQRRSELDDATDRAVELTSRSWDSLTSARASIDSRRFALASAEKALDGVQREAIAGTRTSLDVLNAQQEVSDARVALIRARFDEWSAAATVLAAMGHYTAADLNLPVERYDATRNYDDVRDRWFGTDVITDK